MGRGRLTGRHAQSHKAATGTRTEQKPHIPHTVTVCRRGPRSGQARLFLARTILLHITDFLTVTRGAVLRVHTDCASRGATVTVSTLLMPMRPARISRHVDSHRASSTPHDEEHGVGKHFLCFLVTVLVDILPPPCLLSFGHVSLSRFLDTATK